MQRRPLGRTGLSVAPFAFGGNVFGWTADEAMSFRLLDRFVGAGFNLIDTADSYSRWVPGHEGGESESIIGRWIAKRGRHDDVVIATKGGSDMGLGRKCLSADWIVKEVEASLRRLQVGTIDLYQSHWDDPDTPLAETLVTSRDKGLPRYETLQPLYNLYDRDAYEGPLASLCAAEGLGVIPYF